MSLCESLDVATNILYTILLTVNCEASLLAEFVGQTSVLYMQIGKHFDSINLNSNSSYLTFIPHFLSSLLSAFLMLSFFLIYFLTCLIFDLSI